MFPHPANNPPKVELGSKTHLSVPTPLILKLSKLRSLSHVQKSLWSLSKAGLVSTVRGANYEGFRLTYGGLDHLALHAHSKGNVVYSVGNQIGTGKESDIVAVAPPPLSSISSSSTKAPSRPGTLIDPNINEPKETQYALKLHRLGRISFRSIRTNRDYLHKKSPQQSATWLHLSRLAALKEWTFLSVLHASGFPVPQPIAHNRHTLVMQLIEGFPLRQIASVPDPAGLYGELMELILRLAKWGLIHGDFNEFNILIEEDQVWGEEGRDVFGAEKGRSEVVESAQERSENMINEVEQEPYSPDTPTASTLPPHESEEAGPDTTPIAVTPTSAPIVAAAAAAAKATKATTIKLTPIIIDFPQMVSMSHPDAKSYFERDVNCVKRYFSRRFGFTSDEPGPFFEDALRTVGKDGAKRLDVEAEASGFSKKMAKELESYITQVGGDREAEKDQDAEEDEDGGGLEEGVGDE